MATSDVLIFCRQRRLAAQVLSCIMAAAAFWSCGPSDDANSTTSNSSTNKYSIGDKISFTATGNSKPFKVSGWSDAETNQSWTNGPVAILALRIDPTPDPLTLHLKCAGLAKTQQGPPQPVEVLVNDQKVANWDVLNLADSTAAIPPAISSAGGLLTVTLKIPNAVSPKSLGMGEDPRLLGLSCVEASLVRAQP